MAEPTESATKQREEVERFTPPPCKYTDSIADPVTKTAGDPASVQIVRCCSGTPRGASRLGILVASCENELAGVARSRIRLVR